MMHELSVAYEAADRGIEHALEQLPIQYGDYAVWQRKWLTGAVLEQQLEYWRQQLSGLKQLELTTDHVRPPVQTFHGVREPLLLPADLTAALRNLNRQEEVTPFVLLLAGFAALLARYTGQEEIVMGTSSAGRNSRQHEGLIGFFANTLVLRIDTSEDPSFLTLLRRARETALDAYAHQDLPFEKLTEELQPERDLSRTPLFQVMFELQNTPTQPALEIPGLHVSMVQLPSHTTKFDLTLSMFEGSEELMGSIEYNTVLFEAETIKRMLAHYQTLLRSVVIDPERHVSELSLLTVTERKQLLVEWNDTTVNYPRGNQCIHRLIEEQVESTPDATAAAFETDRLTYRELNDWSNSIAAQLLERGLSTESYLPVLMDRSLELPVSLIAIMKAGAAFVPLDVAWPQERILRILEHLDSRLVVTNDGARAQAASLGCEVFIVKRPEPLEATPNPNVSVRPGDPIYVMYTSGSTGRPKGVVVPHRGITNRFLWMDEFFGRNTAASALQTTRHVYDSAVWQFFWPLINGGQTVIPSPSQPLDAEYLTALVEQHRVTILDFVPSVFNRMISHFVDNDDAKHKLRSVETVIIGGEEILPAPTFKFVQHFPRVRLINLYGPTEASIGCVYYEVSETGGSKIPIGKPIANVKTLILDTHTNLVPVGMPGELHLTGVCLSHGYLADDLKTRAAFVEQPFAEIEYDRLYKTGDLARHLPNGNIEFLGRIDNQVKVRGYRIELGEIETLLGQHSDIGEAVVVARQNPAGEKYLMAYFVARDDRTLSASDLRRYLQQHLPEYMAPSAYMQLDSLPLMPNGKVDRQALPKPTEGRPDVDSEYVQPRTIVEQVIANIWEDVLHLDQVGIHDDFFELGGHSLLATQVTSRVRSVFHLELPLRRFFESPTVSGLAQTVDSARCSKQGARVNAIAPVRNNGRVPLALSQVPLWEFEQLLPGAAFINLSSTARLIGKLNGAALEAAFQTLIARHETLRTSFVGSDGEPYQIVSARASFALELSDLRDLPESGRNAAALALAGHYMQEPFDLACAPLVRALLVQLADEEHVLVIVMHHIISDGWSIGVMIRELSVAYEATDRGIEPELEQLPIQYGDYAAWQREWLNGAVLEQQLQYWRQQLSGLKQLELPTDYIRPAAQTFSTSSQSLVLSGPHCEAIRKLGREEGCTTFMVLLSALKLLLHQYTSETDIRVGTLVANRNRKEIEGLIGLFVNTLILRSHVDGNLSFRDFLRRLREVTLDASDHQDVPFELVVKDLESNLQIDRGSLFSVLFILQNTPADHVALPGLDVLPLHTDGQALGADTVFTTFDLIWMVLEGAQTLSLVLRYKSDLFESETIRRMLQRFQGILETAVATPARQIAEFE
jgi:amino acid adenylation domain-containing protein